MNKRWPQVMRHAVLLGVLSSWGCGGISSNTLKARNAAAQQCTLLPIEQQPACARQLPVLSDDEPKGCAFYVEDKGWVGGDAHPELLRESRRPFEQLAGGGFRYGNIVAAGRGCLVDAAAGELETAESKRRIDEERDLRIAEEKKQQIQREEEARQARLAQQEAEKARKEQKKAAEQAARASRETDLWSKAHLAECSKPKTTDACDGAELYAKDFPDGGHITEVRQALAAGANRLAALKKTEAAKQQAQDKREAREACVKSCRQKYETAKPGLYEVFVNRCVANEC